MTSGGVQLLLGEGVTSAFLINGLPDTAEHRRGSNVRMLGYDMQGDRTSGPSKKLTTDL